MDSQTWARLETVFFAALDLPPGQRAAYLDEACAGDPALRAEVAAMLAAHEDSGTDGLEIERALLNEGGHPALRDTAAHEGMEVGPWRLSRLLGTGGMGEVWLASRTGGDFEQAAAVKLVRPGWRTTELAARFRHERRLLARLAHPNIAMLLDGGLTAEGTPYLAMEYVDGRPITAWCAERSLDLRQRLKLFREVCEAVRFAHANLVVHRDLKPANILVTGEGRPVLLDFGIAKLLDAEDADTAVTRADDRLLTPEHAAPEQLRGEAATVATDVWALGALLFEMLAGQRPFDVSGKTPRSIERIVCESDPPRPSAVAAPADARALRGDLDAIVLTAMRRDPEQRYLSVEQLATDVELHLAGMPVRARPEGLGYHAAKFVRRHRTAVAAMSAFVLLLAASAASWWQQARVVSRERDRAVSANRDSEQAIAMMIGLFGVANPRVVPGGDTLRVNDLLRLMTAELDSSTESPRVRAKLWSALAEIHTSWSRHEEAESAAVRGIAAAHEGDLVAEDLLLSHQRARVVLYRDGQEDAEPLLRESLARHEAHFGPTHQELVPVLQDLALATVDRDEAARLLARALDITRRSGDGTSLASLHNAIGSNHWAAGRRDSALASFGRAYGLLAARVPPGSPDLLSVRSNMAVCEAALGRYAEAERSHREILEGRRRIFGDASLPAGNSRHQLAVALSLQCRHEEAVAALRTAIEALIEAVGPEHGDTMLARRSLASALIRAGRVDEGFAEMAAVQEAFAARGDADSEEGLRVRLARAEMELACGRAVPVGGVRAIAAAAKEAGHGSAQRDAARVLGLAALTAPAEALPGEAEAALGDALAAVEATDGPDHANTHFLRTAFLLARHQAGKPVDAAALRTALDGCNPCGMASAPVLHRAREVLAALPRAALPGGRAAS